MKRLLIGMVVAGCSAVGIPAFADGGFGRHVEVVRQEVRYNVRPDAGQCDDLRDHIAIEQRQADEARRCGRPDLALERHIAQERLELDRLTRNFHVDHFAPVRHDFDRHDHDRGHFDRDGRR